MRTCPFFRLAILSFPDGCGQAVFRHRPTRVQRLVSWCGSSHSHWLLRAIRCVLAGFLVLTCQVTFAQTEPVSVENNTLAPARRGPRDTIAAVQEVFSRRRRGGAILLGGSAAFISAMAVSTALEDKSFLEPGEVALLAAIGTAPAWIWGFVKQTRFSTLREQQVLADYRQLHTIPRFVRRRMRLAK